MQKTQQERQWTVGVYHKSQLQQIDLLQAKQHSFKSKKWKQLVIQFEKNGFKRSEKELKNKWKNIIDTSNDHKKWTFLQLKILYESVFKQGSNWSSIRKRLNGRSCMKLKNTFYGAMRKFLKEILQQLSTDQKLKETKNIKILPSIYLHIFCGKQQFAQIGSLVLQSFRKFNYEVSHFDFKNFLNYNRQGFQIICKILQKNKQKICSSTESSKQQVKSPNQSQHSNNSQQIQQERVIQIINLNTKQNQVIDDYYKDKDENIQKKYMAGYRELISNQTNVTSQPHNLLMRQQENFNTNNGYYNENLYLNNIPILSIRPLTTQQINQNFLMVSALYNTQYPFFQKNQ